jgi:hypothetical protein
MSVSTADFSSVTTSIQKLKKEKNAVLLAHYYKRPEIQEAADFLGDSLYLAQQAAKTRADIIVFAGVHFMAETAKIVNPTKKVLLPDLKAGCSLADSCPPEAFKKFKAQYPDAIVVTYINCSEEIKALSDIICTSSNAERIKELEAWGCQFDRATNTKKWHLTQEGGHSEKRIIHHKDQTGLEIQTVLLQKIKTLHNVTILSEHILIDLITDHQFKGHPQRCYGAYIISKSKKQIHSINSSITVLATGGVGQLYQITTNPKGATGDGIGAAYRAGVQISELPYMQFHPTVVYQKKGIPLC